MRSWLYLVVCTSYVLLLLANFNGWSRMSVSVLRLVGFLTSGTHQFLRYYDSCHLCVVEVNFVFGIDSNVVCVGQLACAEQGMLYLKYNMHALCWLSDVVVEFVDCCCFCLLPKRSADRFI